jgi:hypothetical protein
MILRFLQATLCAIVLTMSAAAHATLWPVSAQLSGGSEVPSNPTTGSGTFVAVFDDSTNTLTYTLTYQGLTGPITASHVHMAPAGVNGPVIVTIGALPSPMSGSAVLTAPQAAALMTGGLYVNVHTAIFPGGEIRGQLAVAPPAPIPALSPAALLMLSLLVMLAVTRSRRRR